MLTWLLAAPVLGIVVILLLPRNSVWLIRLTALAATAIAFGFSLSMLAHFDTTTTQMQWECVRAWVPQLNINYHLGVDGISFPLVLLTTFLSLLACMGSWVIHDRHKEYFALFLLLEAGMLGTFIALDLFLFYIFWEIVLVPMYFLIGIWGGGRKEYSAFKFFVYTLTGSLFMLLAILAVYLQLGTFDMLTLARLGRTLDIHLQQWLFFAFFLGFAVKVPVFPFHTWLPDAHVDAPTPGSVLLAGVLLKMGGYGFLRIAYPFFPEAARMAGWAIVLLGTINIVYGAFVALAQTDFKKLVAYSSVSHMGFVLLGLASGTALGVNGAMFQMISHGLISGAMFLLVGVIYERTHTRQLEDFGGLGARIPVYGGFLIFFSLASLGLPGLSGFVAEFMTMVGAFGAWRWYTIVSTLGIVMAAAYMLKVIRQVLLGPLNEKWKTVTDMTWWERLTLAPLMLSVLALGVFPLALLKIQQVSIQQFIEHVTR